MKLGDAKKTAGYIQIKSKPNIKKEDLNQKRKKVH